MSLAGWAQSESVSRGRRHPEPEHSYRGLYARDRDRIVHCRAFRRLEYKTQVFVNHEGDHYRTRLTHSLEVSLIARTVARALRLNADLAESLALSHDLGHSPFGHLGEDVLGPLLAAHGGFDHNRQTLRIVEVLEQRYPDFPGLNLSWEVREGIVKHSGTPDVTRVPEAAEYEPGQPPTLEAQLIDIVDEIAYNHHDLDDGIESGLLDVDELAASVPLFGRPYSEAKRAGGARDEGMWVKQALRRVIDGLVTDLIRTTREAIRDVDPGGVDDIRTAGHWLAALSPAMREENALLKSYLQESLYRHPRMNETRDFFAGILRDLYLAVRDAPSELPARFIEIAESDGAERAACDYIAGMTDRFAMQEHRRLCGGPGPDSVPMASR